MQYKGEEWKLERMNLLHELHEFADWNLGGQI